MLEGERGVEAASTPPAAAAEKLPSDTCGTLPDMSELRGLLPKEKPMTRCGRKVITSWLSGCSPMSVSESEYVSPLPELVSFMQH